MMLRSFRNICAASKPSKQRGERFVTGVAKLHILNAKFAELHCTISLQRERIKTSLAVCITMIPIVLDWDTWIASS